MIGIVRLKLSRGKYLTEKILWKNKKATFYIIRRAIIVARQTLIPSMMTDTLIVSRVIQQQEEMI
tara:strand:- start:1457 stop:1651 length:195 start_codon:yes stop_codon:yes gene_type:complete